MMVRVGLIGAGVMGADHARIVADEIPGAALQVVCDVDAARARDVADAADAMTDPEEMIARSDVDAVLIASPDATHGPLTKASVEAGKPVMCEKPLAPSAAECLGVVEAEAAAGRRLVQVGFMRRFDPSYAEMRRALGDGRIGDALMLHCFHRNVTAPDWFTAEMAVTNSAPHEFDIARFLLDEDPAAITAFRPGAAPAVGAAPVLMVIETAAGRLVSVEVNNNAGYGYDVRGELVGTKGSVSLRTSARTEINAELRRAEAYPADWRPRFAEAYRLQAHAWIRSVASGVPDLRAASAWDGYMATLLAEAGVRALAERRRVAVEPAPRPSFYD